MAASHSNSLAGLVLILALLLLLLLAAVGPVFSESNSTVFRPREEMRKYRRIRAHLKRLNKPPLKTIESPDGDLIDCVLSHLQPAFDHPRLKGSKPMDPPERPKGHAPDSAATAGDEFQLWRTSGESCPEGSVPIRRTTEEDILRASSAKRFGRKPAVTMSHDSESNDHEHAVGYVVGDQYYGAKASINVWAPKVTSSSEFSLSQIWIISGSFGTDLNTIEAGWQVPSHHGNWWLELGSGTLVGYWPSFLFSHLSEHASMVQFGGEVVNTQPMGEHTSTQMGSGQFAGEGFGRASYFRNLQVVDWDNSLVPAPNLRVLADHPNCYDIQGGINAVWGNYFYYGGPGRDDDDDDDSCS